MVDLPCRIIEWRRGGRRDVSAWAGGQGARSHHKHA
jgi:hypothetical protein